MGFGIQLRIGCGEWDTAMDKLKILLDQAENLTLTDSPAYANARGYYDQNTGFFGAPALLVGSQCTQSVTEVNGFVASLGAAIQRGGAAPAIDPSAIPPPAEENPFSLVRWVVIGAVALSGAVVVAQIVPLLKRTRARSTAGYRRRRR